MTLHPIAVVEQVLDEYRSYLQTEFRARDEKLRKSLEDALAEPRFLAQEPFFQAHRPFVSGKRWDSIGLDPGLAKVMVERSGKDTAYLHQSDAIERLLGADAGPVVVTTGTGSGKTECFLLPVLQNAIEDSVRFNRSGLTAILVYPMNALANDQLERIDDYLKASGHTHVRVGRYDRSTPEEDRQRWRRSPPHVLLTNYMMLEYLLVRPADRDDLFANHRCRFVVLDEVHSYRGALGANIALLFRRLVTHLKHARQDWQADDPADQRRFPALIPVATSATIKSVEETGRTPEEVRQLRDDAVQGFLASLTGFPGPAFRVLGESIEDIAVPAEARWATVPSNLVAPAPGDAAAVHGAVAALAGGSPDEPLDALVRRAAIFWKLGEWLARKPMSLSQIVGRVMTEVPERADADPEAVRREVSAALVAGAALPDGMPGSLRLRTHRFIRGGWRFYRCVDPSCGKLYPMGEERCTCGMPTAPLYLCRSCGAHTLRFRGAEKPDEAPLTPSDARDAKNEWVLYERAEGAEADEDTELVGLEQQMKDRLVLKGSFEPSTCAFSLGDELPVPVVLAPGRNRCLVCGGTAGSRAVLTAVALGTSAAVRVVAEGLVEALAEQNRTKPKHDGKERLLVFADSRQDAAHQARFITYAGRYDRMRRLLVRVLREAKGPMTVEQAVQALMVKGVEIGDNPRTEQYRDAEYLPQPVQENARAWEEAPLLDDLAVGAAYRATVFNLGLVGVRYEHLDHYVASKGKALVAELGIDTAQLAYLARCLLDEMRWRGALSRPLLAFHPASPNCPDALRIGADWERRLRNPAGYPCTDKGDPLTRLDRDQVPVGITVYNVWRGPKGGGRGPRIEQRFKRLLDRLGGALGTDELLLDVLKFLAGGPRFLVPVKLYGTTKTHSLLQVNADLVQIALLEPADRFRCGVCNVRLPWVAPGTPCPACHGSLQPWDPAEVEQNRYARRILTSTLHPLVAGEHTAQITGEERIELEDAFKAPPPGFRAPADWQGTDKRSAINVLACSPTLEMGIDVGGLDAVVMRNVPPRADNYAQRGGRAGRRSRVGIVLGYTRATPHDGYFYDHPEEMIAGEVPAPSIGLGNRDVVLRHLHAIAIGRALPGLAGKMGDYVTLKGEVIESAVDSFVDGVKQQLSDAQALATEAWGPEVLGPAGLSEPAALKASLAQLPDRIRHVFERVRHQILQLEETIKRWQDLGKGDRAAINAMELKRRLLGMRAEGDQRDADDRTSGHPMRRFAELGVLPGYEFPNEPASLRLWHDRHEEEPILVERRFGIAQYQPGARAHARGHRWRVVGLDQSSPWNPKSPDPGWLYVRCKDCDLRYDPQAATHCPRCGSEETIGKGFPGYEFGGFLALRDDTPVLEEEDRFAIASLVNCYPQWNGKVLSRWQLPTGWSAQLRAGEEVRWLNEWQPPSAEEQKLGKPCLHEQGRGFYVCPGCGRILEVPDDEGGGKAKGRKKAKKDGEDRYGHGANCPRAGEPPRPLAITTRNEATTLRFVVDLPPDFAVADYQRWGYSLGYALRTGMRQLYLLDGSEIEFVLEPMWESHADGQHFRRGALTFVDPALGGSGFLERAAEELHLVARRTLEHLDHPNCESACYRCLKSYQNQRHHAHLSWPHVLPDLEALASAAPTLLPAEKGDGADPRPWLDAYEAGVGSPLELAFLKQFEKLGIVVDKQVPVSPDVGGKPISVADFVVSGTRTAIYVDGAAFHRGAALRRDRYIRQRLVAGNPPWKVVELRAEHLKLGEKLLQMISQ